MRAEREGEPEKVREEGVSEVEMRRQPAPRGGREGRTGLGRGRTLPPAPARAHLGSTRVHADKSRARRLAPHLARALPPTRPCPRVHSHTHAQTQTHADTLTSENSHTHTRKHTSSLRHQEPIVRIARCSLTPPRRHSSRPWPQAEPTVPTPSLSPSFPPASRTSPLA